MTDAAGNTTSTDTEVFGWSKGFVVFRTTAVMTADGDSKSIAIVPYVSADGLTWTKGQPLDVKGLDALGGRGGARRGTGGDPGLRPRGAGNVRRADDATTSCGCPRTACRGAASTQNAYTYIDAGSSGYVATDYSSNIWISTDGVAWKAVNMATAGTKGILVDGATAFAGGFVVAASVPVPAEGCGTGSAPKTPSLWWSRDGRTWSRDALNPALTGSQASASVQRINDNALLAIGMTWGKVETSRAWTSSDGRAWTSDPDSQVLDGSNRLLTNGTYGLLVSSPDNGKVSVWGFNRELRLVALPQTGDLPTAPLTDGNRPVLGSAGLIVSSTDGTRFWLGTPTGADRRQVLDSPFPR